MDTKAQLLEEGRDIMARMVRYMTFNLPGQGPFTDARERDRLLKEFWGWEATVFAATVDTSKSLLPGAPHKIPANRGGKSA